LQTGERACQKEIQQHRDRGDEHEALGNGDHGIGKAVRGDAVHGEHGDEVADDDPCAGRHGVNLDYPDCLPART